MKKARVLFNLPEEGGRPAVPIGDGYAPYLRVDGLAQDVAIRINGMPSQNGRYEVFYEVDIEVMYPSEPICAALSVLRGFSLIEGAKTIGVGEFIDR